MAEIRASGTWGSALTSDEFAVIRSVGFEPVGQVLGARRLQHRLYRRLQTAQGPGDRTGTVCRLARSPSVGPRRLRVVRPAGPGDVRGAAQGPGPDDGRVRRACVTVVVGRPADDRVVPGRRPGVQGHRHRHPRARRPAGVRRDQAHHKGAVRAPFTSDLTGQDFAKLIMKGWVPAGWPSAISIGSRHDDWLTVGQTRWDRETPRLSATPSSSTTPGMTPGSSWRRTCGGSGPKA